jgi:Cilia- and flagella-associated protein 298
MRLCSEVPEAVHGALTAHMYGVLQAVDAETQKAMMAWYHKKQEEQKALEENQDDTYMQASWASGKSLKAHFSGINEVKLPH